MSNARPEGQDTAAESEIETEIEHQANTNQVRHEPVPASHHDERRPDAVVRNEESAARSAGSGGAVQEEARRRDELDGAGKPDPEDSAENAG